MEDLSSEKMIFERTKERFEVTGSIARKRRIILSIEKNSLRSISKWLNKQGFSHLSAISATDWPEKNSIEVTYLLWSYEQKILISLKSMIPRDQAMIDSVVPIWADNAQVHERELHELFGINFEGNDDLSPLFVDDWDGPPAFLKDFDWRTFVCEQDYDKTNEREKEYYE
jgi:NADH-quinone oxidoreductase subunit C